MIKFYKSIEGKGLCYKEAWYDKQKSAMIKHEGKVGFIGKNEERQVNNSIEAEEFLLKFAKECQRDDFKEIRKEDHFWLVVQFPLKSKFGNKRDLWLKDKVQEYLKNHLGWYGLGDVDGFDMGNNKLNIFCLVVMEDKAVSSVKTCLKDYRLDLTRARIATKKFNDDEYQLKYSHKKIEKFEIF